MGIRAGRSPETGSSPSLPLHSPPDWSLHPAPGAIEGLGDRALAQPRAQAPVRNLTSVHSHVPAWSVGLPFHIDVTRHLSSEWVCIIQNYILRVPDDDSELIAEGCIGGGFSDSREGSWEGLQEGPGPGPLTRIEHLMCAQRVIRMSVVP